MKKARKPTAAGETLRFIPPPGSEDLAPAPIDRHFARLMVELNREPSPELELAAQMASAWRGAGHICVPLATPNLATKLRATRVVGPPGTFHPLILDAQDRLYLARYWEYEHTLASALQARLGDAAPHDATLLAAGLDRFFPGSTDPRQSRAAATAIEQRLCVITGGPGTGKTRTVVIILALLIAQFAAQGKLPRLALAAPTGKAGARLKEAIQMTADALALPDPIRAALPADAMTLHRLLGPIPDSPYFRHDAAHPLAIDAVIVDEASMVDLALMAKLVAAVPAAARLILLGDKDQLASVDAGYVLGDICQAPADRGSAQIVELQTNYRFGNDSGIFRLATAINRGDADGALTLLAESRHADLAHRPLTDAAALPAALRTTVVERFRPFLEAPNPREALVCFNRFRILCALRRGPFGVENLNCLAEQILADSDLIDTSSPSYAGRPIVILRNDARLHLFNGDIGLLLPDPEAGQELRAFFLDAAGMLRRFLPARLPEHETVFAMTVHKSQGSEFERVLLILPDRETPVATRELVYTGVTRARTAVELWSNEPILRAAIARRTERASGLRAALWPAPA